MILLVGEAPNATVRTIERRGVELTGAAGHRLATLAGISTVAYLRRTERRNLLDAYPGPTWPHAEARRAAEAIARSLPSGQRVVLLGRRVAYAWGLRSYDLLEWTPFWAPWREATLLVAVVPHPSGRNRWYNEESNRAAAAAFLSDALGGRAPEPASLSVLGGARP